jgi:hypothetical protein
MNQATHPQSSQKRTFSELRSQRRLVVNANVARQVRRSNEKMGRLILSHITFGGCQMVARTTLDGSPEFARIVIAKFVLAKTAPT